MCGIIARISIRQDTDKTLLALKELEYRGYDSQGIMTYNAQKQEYLCLKIIGTFQDNEIEKISKIKSNIDLAHTRWATHGKLSDKNTHPHSDQKNEFHLVLNGIIENHEEIREILAKENIFQKGESDAELIPLLFQALKKDEKLDEEKLLNKTIEVIEMLRGDFSFVLRYENYLIAYKNINPLIIGNNGEDEIFICSDLNIINKISKKYHIMENSNIFLSKLEKNQIIKSLYKLEKEKIEFKEKECIKNTIENKKEERYFMEKEIMEQEYMEKILEEKNMEKIKILSNLIKENKKIFLIGAGTSYHSALNMHYQLLNQEVQSQAIIASELKNYLKIIKNSNIIIYSQSGETADIISHLETLSQNENSIISITNSPNSTIDRYSNLKIHLNCGPEISVASTKAFTFQIMINEITNRLCKDENIEDLIKNKYKYQFKNLINKKNIEIIDKISKDFIEANSFFFIGRDKNYPIALEGALKLKEITYIHAEGFAGGELKHGPLSLISKNTPIIVLGECEEIISNATELKTREAKIIGISEKHNQIYDYHIQIPNIFKEIFASIIMQIISLKMTLLLNQNPDRPRNLAKSVTVK